MQKSLRVKIKALSLCSKLSHTKMGVSSTLYLARTHATRSKTQKLNISQKDIFTILKIL
jgi:hypothetical protein